MAQTPKSWQDAFTASFGEEGETHGAQAVDKNGLVVGGVYTATPGTATDGDFLRLMTDAQGNLMVNLAAGEEINVGTLTLGTIEMIKAGTISMLKAGTIDKLAGGTVDMFKGGTINNGSIQVTAGTVAVNTPGTITSGSIAVTAGTGIVTNGSIVVTDGTVKVTTPGTITSGTISVNTPGTITSGSIAVTAGTGIITNGSIVVTSATISAGTMQLSGTPNIGTIDMISAGTISNATVNAATVNAGTINTGTINSGTINAGTINSGTINAGTIRLDPRPSQNIVSFGTQIAATAAATAALLAAAGAGTYHWISAVSISQVGVSTTDYAITFSAINTGTGAVVARANLGLDGVYTQSFPYPVNGGSANGSVQLVTAGVGTANVTIAYYDSV